MEMYFMSGRPPVCPDVTVIGDDIVIACTDAEYSIQYADGSGYTVSMIATMRVR